MLKILNIFNWLATGTLAGYPGESDPLSRGKLGEAVTTFGYGYFGYCVYFD
jgi:hypothetical protein